LAAELAADLQADANLIFLFVSPHFPAARVIGEVSQLFAPTPVFGCTTAGEIGPDGFSSESVVGMSIRDPSMRIGVGLAPSMAASPLSVGRQTALAAVADLGLTAEQLRRERHVAITLIDGRVQREESFIAGVASALPTIGIVGGSASDEVSGPPRARVLANGGEFAGAGLVVLFETDAPFTLVVSEHMVPTEKRVVVTSSDPETRTVHELNGRPARLVFEELVGQPVDSEIAGRYPFAQYLGGSAYIRSVFQVVGSSLQFACAVEDGVVLRLVEPGDIIARTDEALVQAAQRVGGEIAALLAFNCLGRFLETEATGKTGALGEVLARYPVVGFNTFGEQVGALHVNHTLTGLAFGGSGHG